MLLYEFGEERFMHDTKIPNIPEFVLGAVSVGSFKCRLG